MRKRRGEFKPATNSSFLEVAQKYTEDRRFTLRVGRPLRSKVIWLGGNVDLQAL